MRRGARQLGRMAGRFLQYYIQDIIDDDRTAARLSPQSADGRISMALASSEAVSRHSLMAPLDF